MNEPHHRHLTLPYPLSFALSAPSSRPTQSTLLLHHYSRPNYLFVLRPPPTSPPPAPTPPNTTDYGASASLLVYPSRAGVRYGQTITCSTLVIGMPGKKLLSTCRLPRKTPRETLVTIRGTQTRRSLVRSELRCFRMRSFQGIEIARVPRSMNEPITLLLPGRLSLSTVFLRLTLLDSFPLFPWPFCDRLSVRKRANEVFFVLPRGVLHCVNNYRFPRRHARAQTAGLEYLMIRLKSLSRIIRE